MTAPMKQRLLRELDRIATRLLAVHPDAAGFWQAYGHETAPLYRRLSVGEKDWLFERLEATLILHGMSGSPSPIDAHPTSPSTEAPR